MAPPKGKAAADTRPKLRALSAAAGAASAHLSFQRTLLAEACDAADAATASFHSALLAKAEQEHLAAEAAASAAAAAKNVAAGRDELRSRVAAFEADLAAANEELEAATRATNALMADVERLRGFVDEELDALSKGNTDVAPAGEGGGAGASAAVPPAVPTKPAPKAIGMASVAAALEAAAPHEAGAVQSDAHAAGAAGGGAEGGADASTLVPYGSTKPTSTTTLATTPGAASSAARSKDGLAAAAARETSNPAAARLLAAHDLISALLARGAANAAALSWLRGCLRCARGGEGGGGVEPPPLPSYSPACADLVSTQVGDGTLSPAAGAFFAFCAASLRSSALPAEAVLPTDEALFKATLSKLDGLMALVDGAARDAAASVVKSDDWLSYELFEAAMKQARRARRCAWLLA